MQATLLSIAIALILALVAALVGPHFVDWNKYRSEFESQASRMTGLDVNLAGPIEARLLPTPSVTLQRVEIRGQTEIGSLRARKLSIEFSLGSLARGQWKATDVRIEGAEFAAALDRAGRLEWPAPAFGFDPDAISIEHLDIRDSRALLADSASGSGIVLDEIEFSGELRTLAGPLKGQGSFYLAGLHYPYRITASRAGDEGVRVRVNVDPIDRPLTADADGFVSIEGGMPRFAGTVTLARPVSRAPAGSPAEIIEPWRLTSKVDGNSKRATIGQIEFQYGPDDRPIRLRGDASVSFGSSPRVTGVLSSSQVDLDRILGLPESQRQQPFAAIKAFTETFIGSQRLPLPVDLGVTVEGLTLAGATIQRFSGDFRARADGWNIERLELRAPGLTQLAMAGRLAVEGGSVSFKGRTRLESKDPKALIAWLTNRADVQTLASGGLTVDGNFSFSNDQVSVEDLKADLDRMSVQGRLSYAWGKGDQPPRMEAVVSSPEMDLDRAYGLVQGLFDGSVFDWPREGLLSARIDRATLAGVEASRANLNIRFDKNGLNVERLAIGDFGGVALAAKGGIDLRGQAPRGMLTLDMDSRRLDGVTALIGRISPQAAVQLRRNAERAAPLKLSASVRIGAASESTAESNAHFEIVGSAGAVLLNLRGEIGAHSADLSLANFARLRSATINLGGELVAKEGAALIAFLGLDRVVAVGPGESRISVSARGALDRDLAVQSRLVAGALDAAAKGSLRVTGNGGASADIDLQIATADLRVPQPSDRPARTLPATLRARLSVAEGVLGVTELNGKLAGTDVNGRLTIALRNPLTLAGELTLSEASFPATIAALIGMPPSGNAAWSAEPFERGLIGDLDGSMKLRIGRLTLSPALSVADMRGVLQFGPDSLAVDRIDGSIAGGRVAGGISFEHRADALRFASNIRVAGVNLAELTPDGALTGRATFGLDLNGVGRSPIALVGSLEGEGTFTVQEGSVARVDPSAFAAVIHSVDEGLPIDPVRIRDRMEAGLGKGPLAIAFAQGEIAATAGQIRLTNTAIRTKDSELGVHGNIDLARGTINAQLSLTGAGGSGAPAGTRPEIKLLLRGPIAAPQRRLDVVAFTNWLALRAIEEKDKRINALQSGAVAPVAPPVPAPQGAEPPAVRQSVIPPDAAPAPNKPHADPEIVRSKARVAPSGTKAPPPPTDIRPPPAAKVVPSQSPQAQPARPRARSWLESLFGP
jgi:large subunit ribosomal protein L24